MRRARAVAIGLALLAASARAGDSSDANSAWLRWRLVEETSRTDSRTRAAPRGEAFRSGAAGGGAVLELPGAGRIDLTSPGALAFAITPEQWRADGDYVPFLTVRGKGKAAFIVERARPTRGSDERLLVGFFGLRDRIDLALDVPLSGWSGSRSRREIAVSWDETGFAVAVGAGPFMRRPLPPELVAEAFAPGGTRLVVGSPHSETTAIYSLRVYARALE